MGTVRKIITAAAVAGLMAAIPLSTASAEPKAPTDSSSVVINGGQGDWPLKVR